MSRTVELGRAVLSSGNTSIQLWLTTLITVSQITDATNMQLLHDAALIDHLAAGDLWVRRGNGMEVVLEVTEGTQALDRVQVDRLTNSILNAPVWNQLGLRVSLPSPEVEEHPDNAQYLHFAVDHCRLPTSDPSEPQRHRIGAHVHIADTRPPELVPVVALERVHHKVTFLKQATSRARIAESSPRKRMSLESTGKNQVDEFSVPVLEAHSDMSNTQLLTLEPSQGLQTPNDSQQDVAVALSEENRDHDKSQTTLLQSPMQESRKRKRLSTPLPSDRNQKRDHLLFSDIEKLVDAAMRLSVSKKTPRLPAGVRTVTHTFVTSLSDVCPSMWSPQFLSALSHRTPLLSTISRSLLKATGPTPRSEALRRIIHNVTRYGQNLEDQSGDTTDATDNSGTVDGSIQARLWLHTQKKLSARPVKPHNAFCSYRRTPSPEQGSDDMLEETWQTEGLDQFEATIEDSTYGLATPLSEPDTFPREEMALDPGSPLLEPSLEHEILPDSSRASSPSLEVHSDDILEPEDNHHPCEFTDEQDEAPYRDDAGFYLDKMPGAFAEHEDRDESLNFEQADYTSAARYEEEEGQLYASVPLESEQLEGEEFPAAIPPLHEHGNSDATLFEDPLQHHQEDTVSNDLADGLFEDDMEVDECVSQDLTGMDH